MVTVARAVERTISQQIWRVDFFFLRFLQVHLYSLGPFHVVRSWGKRVEVYMLQNFKPKRQGDERYGNRKNGEREQPEDEPDGDEVHAATGWK
jgi:hypothetical protein